MQARTLSNRSKFFGLMLVLSLSLIPILSASNIANAETSGSMPSNLLANSVEYRLLSTSGTTPSLSPFSQTIRVVVTTTNGTSKLISTAGLTAPAGYSSADWTDGAASLVFEGSQSAINSAIATLSFKGSTPGIPATVRLNAILAGPAYNPDNGHYYEVFNLGSKISWTDARAAAKTRTYNGLVGYLATITSAEEQAFLYSKTQAAGWIGASDGFDVSTDQIWKWADGPEAGQTFWTGWCGTGSHGICAATGMYNFWNVGEPNNSLGPEESLEFGLGSGGQWNDLKNDADESQYIIEYGGGGGTVAETFDATTQITVAGNPSAPTGLTVTPRGGQLDVSFSEVSGANLNGGTLVRYEYQQDGGPWISLGTSTTTKITGLTNDAIYNYAVRTITTDGTEFISAASETVSAIPALAPTAPRNVKTKLSGTSVTVAWSAPTYDGGSPIVRYLAKVTPAAGEALTCNTFPISGNLPLRTCVITGLEVGTAYTLTVTADNAALSSPDSSLIRFAVPQAAVTTSGSIPGKIVRIAPTSLFGVIPTGVQQQLGNAGIVVPPSGAKQIRISSNLSVSSINSQSTTLLSEPVTSGSEIILQIVPPSDTPVGTLLRGGIELPDGTLIDIGNVTLDANEINLGTGPAGFTIVPPGNYKVYFYLGEPVAARARALVQSGQIEVVYDLSVSSGPSGIPLLEDPSTPTPTVTSTNEPSPEPSPTETPVEPSPEVVIDARGLEVINPLEDAPLAVAETAVSAIALAAGAAAAAAGAASAAGARSGGGSRSGRGSKSSSSSGGDSGAGDGATIEGIDFESEDFSAEALKHGDKLKIWSLTAATALDKPSHNAAIKISQFSPLTAKLITDAAYLRAMFGTFAALLPALGVALGLVGTIDAGGLVLPPSATVLMTIAVLGIFDALAGLIAVTIFTIGISLTAGISTAGDVRMMMGLFIIGFGPALLADAFRSLRRPAAQHHHHWWERVVDLAVAPLIGGWAVQGMVSALPSLAGVKLPIADHADAIAIAAALALAVRVLLEEFVAHVFPGRLDFLHPTELASSSNLQQVLALTLRSLIFCFVASAFIGTTWHLYVGTLIFAVPSYLGLLQDRLPNYPKLYHLLPAGLPGLAFTLVISAYSLAVLISVFGETPDLAKVAFVLLPIPSTILGVIGMFGREAEPDDVRWYQRESLTWLYRIGGTVILVVTLRLAGII